MGDQHSGPDHNPLEFMQAEFRRSLQLFYSRLQLAPPYDSVEKALRRLTLSVRALPAADQQRLLSDQSLRWNLYRRAFVDSGLNQKHRGIIAGLARQRAQIDLPPEFDHFLDLYAGRG